MSFKLEADTPEAHLKDEDSILSVQPGSRECVFFNTVKNVGVVWDMENKNKNKNDIVDMEYIEIPQGVKNVQNAQNAQNIHYDRNQCFSDELVQEQKSMLEPGEVVADSTVKDSVEYNLLYHNVNGWRKNF